MRIVFWAESYRPRIGGVEVFSHSLVHALAVRGHEIAVITGDGEVSSTGREEGVTVHRLPLSATLLRRAPGAIHELRAAVRDILRAFSPELIHLNTMGPSITYLLDSPVVASVPLLVSIHGLPAGPPLAPDSLRGQALARARAVTCCSRYLSRLLCRERPDLSSKISVVHPCLPPGTGSQSKNTSDIACVGRLVEGKGFDLAIGALALLSREFEHLHLTLAGDGPERESLDALARRLGVSNRIRFTGWLDPLEVPALLERATVVMVPSRHPESFGLVALQAAWCARPVIARALGGLTEIVSHGRTGLLIGADEPAEYATALRQLLEDPAQATAMGLRARDRALHRFSFGGMVRAYEDLYRGISSEPGHVEVDPQPGAHLRN